MDRGPEISFADSLAGINSLITEADEGLKKGIGKKERAELTAKVETIRQKLELLSGQVDKIGEGDLSKLAYVNSKITEVNTKIATVNSEVNSSWWIVRKVLEGLRGKKIDQVDQSSFENNIITRRSNVLAEKKVTVSDGDSSIDDRMNKIALNAQNGAWAVESGADNETYRLHYKSGSEVPRHIEVKVGVDGYYYTDESEDEYVNVDLKAAPSFEKLLDIVSGNKPIESLSMLEMRKSTNSKLLILEGVVKDVVDQRFEKLKVLAKEEALNGVWAVTKTNNEDELTFHVIHKNGDIEKSTIMIKNDGYYNKDSPEIKLASNFDKLLESLSATSVSLIAKERLLNVKESTLNITDGVIEQRLGIVEGDVGQSLEKFAQTAKPEERNGVWAVTKDPNDRRLLKFHVLGSDGTVKITEVKLGMEDSAWHINQDGKLEKESFKSADLSKLLKKLGAKSSLNEKTQELLRKATDEALDRTNGVVDGDANGQLEQFSNTLKAKSYAKGIWAATKAPGKTNELTFHVVGANGDVQITEIMIKYDGYYKKDQNGAYNNKMGSDFKELLNNLSATTSLKAENMKNIGIKAVEDSHNYSAHLQTSQDAAKELAKNMKLLDGQYDTMWLVRSGTIGIDVQPNPTDFVISIVDKDANEQLKLQEYQLSYNVEGDNYTYRGNEYSTFDDVVLAIKQGAGEKKIGSYGQVLKDLEVVELTQNGLRNSKEYYTPSGWFGGVRDMLLGVRRVAIRANDEASAALDNARDFQQKLGQNIVKSYVVYPVSLGAQKREFNIDSDHSMNLAQGAVTKEHYTLSIMDESGAKKHYNIDPWKTPGKLTLTMDDGSIIECNNLEELDLIRGAKSLNTILGEVETELRNIKLKNMAGTVKKVTADTADALTKLASGTFKVIKEKGPDAAEAARQFTLYAYAVLTGAVKLVANKTYELTFPGSVPLLEGAEAPLALMPPSENVESVDRPAIKGPISDEEVLMNEIAQGRDLGNYRKPLEKIVNHYIVCKNKGIDVPDDKLSRTILKEAFPNMIPKNAAGRHHLSDTQTAQLKNVCRRISLFIHPDKFKGDPELIQFWNNCMEKSKLLPSKINE